MKATTKTAAPDDAGQKLGLKHRKGSPVLKDAPQKLTVKETIGFVFLSRGWEGFQAACRRANEDAKPALRRILKKSSLEEHHWGALVMLGYIGSQNDLTLFRQNVSGLMERQGVLSRQSQNALNGVFHGLGIMYRRGIEEAGRLLKQMIGFEFWRGAKFQWHPEGVLKELPDRRMPQPAIEMAFYGFAVSGKTHELRQLVETTLDEAQKRGLEGPQWQMIQAQRFADYEREALQREHEPIGGAESAAAVSAYLDWRDKIFDRDDPYRRKVDAEEVPERGEKPLPTMKETKPASPQETSLQALIEEACSEWNRIKADILGARFGELGGRLLDSGRTIDAKTLKGLSDELYPDLRLQKDVIDRARKAKAERSDFLVRIEPRSYEVPSVTTEKRKVLCSKDDEIVVSFRLTKTRQIGKTTFPNVRRDRKDLTVAEDGSLVVLMKRIDGVWRWNPFGW